MNKLDVNITDEEKGPLLIIGLGNPGKKYQNTRHNVGFMVVDRLAERCEISWKTGRLKVFT